MEIPNGDEAVLGEHLVNKGKWIFIGARVSTVLVLCSLRKV